ncbi:hypothetical protein L195_g014961 [Trifolium pratense]|uniref:Uncharacterized protein n=1 Tax=Trifolium pratense TaxID=57577 RepID=A0A2K3MM23_TRIPR|nr:hypothetical protein L195_g014961 [Trifolium pratense]
MVGGGAILGLLGWWLKRRLAGGGVSFNVNLCIEHNNNYELVIVMMLHFMYPFKAVLTMHIVCNGNLFS